MGCCTMTKNTSITLNEHFDAFVSEKIESGRYNSASEVIRAGLRLLESNESKLETLRNMLAEGESSEFSDYSYEKVIQQLDSEMH